MQQLTNPEVLQELGRRLRRERANQDLTQARLAERAGLRQATISRVESGQDFTMETLVAMLRALNKLSNLDAFLPMAEVSPLELADHQGKERQRVRPKAKSKSPSWRWGDES